ncbi:MAG TPA: hypothetical protein VFT55_02125, partial [Planctomycetota bacterium]|nr:hypothetical protein [Planctomycetota bacterium]
MPPHFVCVACSLFVFASCAMAPSTPGVLVAHLDDGATGFDALRAAFAAANPGYDVQWHAQCREIEPTTSHRVLFVQGPSNRAEAPTVGDVVLLRAGERWALDAGTGVDLLAFQLPTALPAELPALIRPDWDPRITDTPG